MDWFRGLEIFVAVAEEESFAGAARVTGISPPSVTRVIGELEDLLGAVLFNRTTRVVTLTDIGQGYLVDAQKLLADFQVANDTASGAYREPSGILRITASTLFGQTYIAPILHDYLDMYPDVGIDALFLERVVNLIEEGVDIAIRIGDLSDSSMMAARVGQVQWAHCARPEYFEKHGIPKTPEDLKSHKVISVGPIPGMLEWKFVNHKPVKLKPRLVYSTPAAAIAATTSGWGMTRALSYQIGPQLASGDLQTVLAEYQPDPMPIHVVHTSGKRPSAKVRAFIDLAVERLRKNPMLN